MINSGIMKDGLYQFIVGVVDLFLWGGKLIGEENLPKRGPAVFIANHLDATPEFITDLVFTPF